MKTLIRKALTALALAVGITTAATAATPVAVWDGDFSKTIEGYTLNLNGNTEEDGVITIDQTQGVKVDWTTAMTSGMTVLFKYSNLTLGSKQAIAASCVASGGTADRTGVYLETDNKSHGIWGTATYDTNVTTQKTLSESDLSGMFVLTYKGGSGTYLYRVADAACTCIYGNPKLMSGSDGSIYGCTVGGTRGTTFAAATGLRISGIAIFDKVLTQAEMAAYVFPSEDRTFYATMDGVNGWSELEWNPPMPDEGFSATDTLVITNGANECFNMDQDVTALKLKIVSAPEAPALDLEKNDEEKIVVIGTYDFSEAESKTMIAYDTGAASIVAGKDTVLCGANNPSLTIAAGNKLTVKFENTVPTLTASKVSNAGTLHFMGGTAESPIALTGDGNFGVTTLAEDTYVRNDDKGGNRKYQVTGSGSTSFYEVTRNNGGSPGGAADTTYDNVIVVSGSNGSNTMWLERAALTSTVGLHLKGNMKLSGLNGGTYPVVIRSLTGGDKGLSRNGSETLKICCSEDADFGGTVGFGLTVGEGPGVQTFSGAFTQALTVEAGGKVKLTGAAKPSSISGAGSVMITGTGTVTNTSDTANFTGTITVDAGVTTLFLGTSRPKCDFVFAGTTEIVYTENFADDGVVQALALAEGSAVPAYKVIGIDGTEKTVAGGKYTPSVTGKAAVKAYEFNGDLSNTGSDGSGNMGKDNGPFYDITSNEVFALTQPYKDLTWPAEFTVSIHATLPDKQNACLVAWGTLTGGGIGLTTGDPTRNEVKMVYWSKDEAYTTLATMTVPNAQTSKHLYVFTKTANTLKIYLDGSLVVNYSGAYSLGNGLQVGSVHGGIGNTNLGRLDVVYGSKTDTNACYAVINSMRIYNTVLGPNAMAELVKEFPYDSPNGTFTRALEGDENLWVAEDAWTKQGETFNAPDPKSTVNLSAAEDATVTLNLEESVNYEAMNFSGEGTITIAAEADNTNKLSSSGLVKIGADAAIMYSAMNLSGTPIEIAADKTLTIDCSMIDLSQYYATTTIPLTGLVTGDGEIAFEVPESVTGRSAEVVFNESNNTWELTITVISADFIYDGGAWTWSGEAVTPETVSNHTELAVIVRSGTLEWDMDRASFEVQGGMLKAATAPAVPCTVEVTCAQSSDATFDLNGIRPESEANNFTVTMAGGKLTNSSEAMGIVKSLTITAESTVDTSVGAVAIQSQKGGYAATTLALGEGNALVKTGTNRLEFVTTTVTGTGTIEVEEGTIWTQENSNFGEAWIRLHDTGVFEVREGKTATVKKFDGNGDGAKIIVHGTISDFTLEAEAAIEGEGTFGTITMDGDLYIGEMRGLSIEGGYAVHAQLTLAEMAAAEPITLFTTTSEDITVWLTDYNGKALEADKDYTIDGGIVTPAAKPFVYNEKWTWNGEDVDASVVQANTAAAIIVQAGTCEWNIDRDITVNGGTLKATGTTKANAAITVGEGGTFDVNGKENTEWNVTLNGGSFVNNGTAVGETKKQIARLTVVDADSTVGGSANFGLVAGSWAANTLNLGGQTLTKEGAAEFWLSNTTVTNGTIAVTNGQLTVTKRDVVFANDAYLTIGAAGTLRISGNKLSIAAINSDGGTINNTGKISNFELWGSATLTGNGTWGTNTLMIAQASVGTLRNLPIEGTGTVHVVLTETERTAFAPVNVFTSGCHSVAIGEVRDESGNLLTEDTDYTVAWGVITPVDKRVPVTGVTLDKKSLTLKPEASCELVATIAPETATIATTIWSSSNENVATVEDGVVTAVETGTATITVTVTDLNGNEVSDTCDVTVLNLPSWLEGASVEMIQKYSDWSLDKGVNDPDMAIKEAFLFNVNNDDASVEAAKPRFYIHDIILGTEEYGDYAKIDPPMPADVGVESFNGVLNVRGATDVNGDYTIRPDTTQKGIHFWAESGARFFKAFLEIEMAD